ncbi:MAG: 50S ribosomal protein L24 [Patescibacteria group bacterium]
MKLTKGDEVRVIKGKDKGKTGKIERVVSKTKVLIANVNQYKRHLKRRSEKQQSKIITITKPLPIYNVALICPECKLPTRVGFRVEGDQKIRICKKCEKTV